jgi:hypothetical protein
MISKGGIKRSIRVMGGYVGAEVETEASSAAARAHCVDVAILTAAETLGAAVGGVVKGQGPGAGCRRPVRVVVELAVEVVFNLLSGLLEEVVCIRGGGVDLVVDMCVVFGVAVGVQEGFPIMEAFDRSEGVAVGALGGLRGDDLVLVLILVLNRDGDVVGEVVPVGLDAVFQCLAVHVDTGVSCGLGDVAGEHVGDAPKGDDGEGIGVTDRTLYDLRVHEEMF